MPEKTFVGCLVFALAAGLTSPAVFGQVRSLREVQKIWVDLPPEDGGSPAQGRRPDNTFEQLVKLEISKQFAGAVLLVEDRGEADAILVGRPAVQEKGTGGKISGKFGLNDVKTGMLVLYDRAGKTVLWMEQAGDRYLWLGPMTPESKKKIAERLVKKLRKAYRAAH
jgi:hypothetical protein